MRHPGPRSFEEVVAAQDPSEMARLERIERLTDEQKKKPRGEAGLGWESLTPQPSQPTAADLGLPCAVAL
jgi:hypothetical protein